MLKVDSWAAFPVLKASRGRKKRKDLKFLPSLEIPYPQGRLWVWMCVYMKQREVLILTFWLWYISVQAFHPLWPQKHGWYAISEDDTPLFHATDPHSTRFNAGTFSTLPEGVSRTFQTPSRTLVSSSNDPSLVDGNIEELRYLDRLLGVTCAGSDINFKSATYSTESENCQWEVSWSPRCWGMKEYVSELIKCTTSLPSTPNIQ